MVRNSSGAAKLFTWGRGISSGSRGTGSRCSLGGVGGALELRDVDLGHLEHRFQRAAGSLGVRVRRQLVQALRCDLPRDAVAILDPAADARLAAVRSQAVP